MPSRIFNVEPVQSGLDAFLSGASEAYTGVKDERRKRQVERQQNELLRQQMQNADLEQQRRDIEGGLSRVGMDPITEATEQIKAATQPQATGVRAKIGAILSRVVNGGDDPLLRPTGTFVVKTGESSAERLARIQNEAESARQAALLTGNKDLTGMREAGENARNSATNATSLKVAAIREAGDRASWQTVTTKDGDMMQVNPRTGETRPIGLKGRVSGSGDSLGTVATRTAAATIPELQGAANIIDKFNSPSLMSQLQKKAGVFGNYLNTPEGRQLNQAIEQFVTLSELAKGNKRPTDQMMKRFYTIYAPVPGDDDAVLDQKRQSRQTLIESVKKVAGHMAPGADTTTGGNPFQSLIPKKAP